VRWVRREACVWRLNAGLRIDDEVGAIVHDGMESPRHRVTAGDVVRCHEDVAADRLRLHQVEAHNRGARGIEVVVIPFILGCVSMRSEICHRVVSKRLVPDQIAHLLHMRAMAAGIADVTDMEQVAVEIKHYKGAKLQSVLAMW